MHPSGQTPTWYAQKPWMDLVIERRTNDLWVPFCRSSRRVPALIPHGEIVFYEQAGPLAPPTQPPDESNIAIHLLQSLSGFYSPSTTDVPGSQHRRNIIITSGAGDPPLWSLFCLSVRLLVKRCTEPNRRLRTRWFNWQCIWTWQGK